MRIIYEDQYLLIVDKPAGLPVLPEGWEPEAPYLTKVLEVQYGKIFVIHRLDKITSGVMIFARDEATHRALNIRFEKHEVQKVYHAIVEENPTWEEKVARFPLRVNVGHKHRTVVDDRNGKPSETRFRVLKRYQVHPERSRRAAWVEASPVTGRTHQVRVHALALGHPLLGDTLYGAQESHIITRPALHAYSLTFTHPSSNEPVTFMSDHPEDFAAALKLLDSSPRLGQAG